MQVEVPMAVKQKYLHGRLRYETSVNNADSDGSEKFGLPRPCSLWGKLHRAQDLVDLRWFEHCKNYTEVRCTYTWAKYGWYKGPSAFREGV